jgi:hypothetical protein
MAAKSFARRGARMTSLEVAGNRKKIKKSTFLIFFTDFWIVIFYTTLRAKENLHRFLCKFHITQHIRESVRESRSSGGMGPSLFTHCASFTTTMVTRGRGGGDGRGRGYVGGGNELNNDSAEQSRWKIFATYG